MTEQPQDPRSGRERRRLPRGGRRIQHLATHEDAMISVGDFARYLRVRTRQIWKWHDAGLIEIIQLPERCDRIERKEAIRFLNAHRLTRPA